MIIVRIINDGNDSWMQSNLNAIGSFERME